MQDFQKQFVLAMLGYAASRDADVQQLCRLSGIDYKALTGKSKAVITPQQMENLWKTAGHLTNDPLFGLHFGESMQLAALGIVGQIVQTSNTVGDALNQAGGLVALITDMFRMHIEQRKSSFIIHLSADESKKDTFPFTFRHMAEYLLVFIVHELDGLLLRKIQPVSVRLPYTVTEPYEYSRVFRCPVHKKTGTFSIELNNEYRQLSIISANYELQNQLLQKVSSLVNNTPADGSLQSRIFNYLITNSYLYTMSLEAVAANFNISPRTLQRKLKQEGVSFLQIVDEVRHKLSLHYLSSGNYQVKDVSAMLGYNEHTAFARAFKRWTGLTPAEYQRKTRNA